MESKYSKLSKGLTLKSARELFEKEQSDKKNNFLALSEANANNQVDIYNNNQDNDLFKLTQSTKTSLKNRLLAAVPDNKFTSTTNIPKTYVKFTPNTNTNNQKIISISEIPKDPCLPTKFKHRKMQKDNDDPKVPILHSPTRKLTTEEHKALNIPPCISNWKNSRGYTIPLHIRLTADLRNNQDLTLSDKFSKLSDTLNLTEKQLRKDIEERNKIKDCVHMMDTLKKEQEMLKIAEEVKRQKIKMMRGNTDLSSVTGLNTESFITDGYKTPGYLNKMRKPSELNTNLSEFNSSINTSKLIESSRSELEERNNLRNAAKKQIQRQVHVEKNNYSGKNNDVNVNNNTNSRKRGDDTTRDITENMALGKQYATVSNDFLIDTRLYNNTSGLDSGFKFDDEYDLYDKPLFADRLQANIFKKVGTNFGAEDNTEKVLDSKRIMDKIKQRGKMFEGARDSEFTRNKSNKIDFTREEL